MADSLVNISNVSVKKECEEHQNETLEEKRKRLMDRFKRKYDNAQTTSNASNKRMKLENVSSFSSSINPRETSTILPASNREVNREVNPEETLSALLQRMETEADARRVQRAKEATQNKIQLSEEQIDFVELVQTNCVIFLTGDAGTGKSLTVGQAIQVLRAMSKRVYVTGTTGRVAIQVNGTTVHSFGGIGIGKDTFEVIVSKLKGQQFRRDSAGWRWKHCDVLIIDETPMLNTYIFDLLERVARAIRGNDKWFGGIQVIFVGDFGQLPAISHLKTKEEQEAADATHSKLYGQEPKKQPTFVEPRKETTIEDEADLYEKYSGELGQQLKELDADPDNKTDEKRLWETDTWNQGVKNIVYLTKVFRQRNLSIVRMFKRAKLGGKHFKNKDLKLLKSKLISRTKFQRMCRERRRLDPTCTIPTYLHGHKADVNAFNNEQLNALPGKIREFTYKVFHCKRKKTVLNHKKALNDTYAHVEIYKPIPRFVHRPSTISDLSKNLKLDDASIDEDELHDGESLTGKIMYVRTYEYNNILYRLCKEALDETHI